MADGEHGGDGIDGKEHIGELDGQDDRQQRAFGRLHAANPTGDGGLGGASPDQPPGGVEQEEAEDPGDPVEALQQGNASGDKQAAQDNRSGDAPQESRVLAAGADAKALENDQEDEEIVHAE